jgi:predicted Zn-dependent protease
MTLDRAPQDGRQRDTAAGPVPVNDLSRPLSREQARGIADRVLGMSMADQTRVTIVSGWSGNTRFAAGSITTSGGVDDISVTVAATIGRRRASASTNVLDEASLRRVVDLAAQLARLAPEDPVCEKT